jgi:hypothetical protein
MQSITVCALQHLIKETTTHTNKKYNKLVGEVEKSNLALQVSPLDVEVNACPPWLAEEVAN